MRKFAMVLILINLALGSAQATTPSPGSGIMNCCKGEGEGVYCCQKCCWWGKYCATDSQCRNTNLLISNLEPENADGSA